MKGRTYVFSKTIDLNKIGWSEAKDDEQIAKYIISFMENEYGVIINEETALAFCQVIDNLLTDIERGDVVI